MSPAAAPCRPVAAGTPHDSAVHVRGIDVRVVALCGTSGDLARAEAVLTDEERARACRGTPAVRRRRAFLRAALRQALAQHLGTTPACVPLTVTAAGRPVVPGTDVDVSCSASHGIGVVAVAAGRRVGVDVERVTPWAPEVLEERWLSPAERRALLELPEHVRGHAVARAWTGKESVLKARGSGLRVDPASVAVPVGAACGAVHGWELHELTVPTGWVATLASGLMGRSSS